MAWNIYNNDWNVHQLFTQRALVNLRPEYQRQLVWNPTTQQHLIWCMLRGQDIPKFYFHVRKDKRPRQWDVVDGQQRIDAIWNFVDGKYALSKTASPIDGVKVAGLKFDQLPDSMQEEFLSYRCVVAEIETDDYRRVIDQFLALQFGRTLTGQEKRQAAPGLIRNLVLELGDHEFVKIAQINRKRFIQYEAIARLLLWELRDQIVDSRSIELDRLYLEHASDSLDQSNPSWKDIRSRMLRTFNILVEIFPQHHPELRGIVIFSLTYWLVRYLMMSYVVDDQVKGDFRTWFNSFCFHLRDTQRSEGKSTLQIWSSGTNTGKPNIDRFNYMKKHLLASMPSLAVKDPKRNFTEDQRVLLWERANGRCEWTDEDGEQCNFPLRYDEEWDADHIVPHTLGGKTATENGRVLCPYRNRSGGKQGVCKYKDKNSYFPH